MLVKVLGIELGKNYPLEVGLIGSTKAGLAELDATLAARRTDGHCHQARERTEQLQDAVGQVNEECHSGLCGEEGLQQCLPCAR